MSNDYTLRARTEKGTIREQGKEYPPEDLGKFKGMSRNLLDKTTQPRHNGTGLADHSPFPSKGMCFHVEVGLSISFLVLARVCVFISRSNDLIARLLLVSVSSKVGVSASKSW